MMLLLYAILGGILDFAVSTIVFIIKHGKKPLEIKTFDGYNQPYHPSVLFFPNKWNGYSYWMVITPYPMNGKSYKSTASRINLQTNYLKIYLMNRKRALSKIKHRIFTNY